MVWVQLAPRSCNASYSRRDVPTSSTGSAISRYDLTRGQTAQYQRVFGDDAGPIAFQLGQIAEPAKINGKAVDGKH